jgi:hypothetical protein
VSGLQRMRAQEVRTMLLFDEFAGGRLHQGRKDKIVDESLGNDFEAQALVEPARGGSRTRKLCLRQKLFQTVGHHVMLTAPLLGDNSLKGPLKGGLITLSACLYQADQEV